MKTYKTLLILSIVAVLASSCSDILEPGNNNSNYEDRLNYDPNYSEGLLLDGYSGLNTAYTFSEAGTDDAVSNQTTNSYRRIAAGEWTSNYDPTEEWSDAYKRLYYLNLFLERVDKTTWFYVPTDLKHPKDSVEISKYVLRNKLNAIKLKAQAHALRAIYHFQLIQAHAGKDANGILWGIPLITKPLSVTDNWKLLRDSFSACVRSINADFDSAIYHLPEVYNVDVSSTNKITDFTNINTYKDFNLIKSSQDTLIWKEIFSKMNMNRINATIAKAMKAKFALLVASTAFVPGNTNSMYAAKLNGELIKGFTVSSFPSDAIFYDTDADITNTDILWRYDWSLSNTLETAHFPPSKLGKANINPTQNFVDAFPMKNGYPINNPLGLYSSTAPYTNRDPRLAKYVIYNGNDLNGTVINTTVSSPTNKDGLNLSQYATRTGYYLKKLLRADANLTTNTTKRHFVTLIRFTELFLNYAEAANEAIGPDGDPYGIGWTPRSVLGAIRKRAGITQPDAFLASLTTPEQMRDLIRNERRIELCFEGFRFWDMRRWCMNLNETTKGMKIEGTTPNFTYTIIDVDARKYVTPQMWYGPIPYKETLKYTGLIQNAGW